MPYMPTISEEFDRKPCFLHGREHGGNEFDEDIVATAGNRMLHALIWLGVLTHQGRSDASEAMLNIP